MKLNTKINKTELVKIVIRIGASLSVGSVTGGLIRSHLPFSMGFKEKIVKKIGTFVLVGMVEDRADKYVEETLDKVFSIFQPKKEEIKEESKDPSQEG